MKRFDIAMVGCGGVSRMHFDGYLAHPERVRVVAACDPHEQRVKAAQEKYGFSRACSSVEEMIDQGGWDVAVVCTPTPVREEVVGALASAGKHAFVEKPLADSYEEAARMVATCAAAGVKLAVNQNFRYHYAFDIAKRVIGEGSLGNVLTVAHQELMFRQDSGWRTECARHALAVMGVHWLDGFRWMLGREAKSIVCQTHSSSAIDCVGETDAIAHIVFEGGTSVSYVESFSSPARRMETLAIGERGALKLGYEGATLYHKDERQESVERWENPYGRAAKPESARQALDELLLSLERDTEPSNSGHDNLKTIALLEGAYRSAAEKRVVAFRDGELMSDAAGD